MIRHTILLSTYVNHLEANAFSSNELVVDFQLLNVAHRVIRSFILQVKFDDDAGNQLITSILLYIFCQPYFTYTYYCFVKFL